MDNCAEQCASVPVTETVVVDQVAGITKKEEFSLFPRLAREIRDMVWDYGIDLTTTPSLVQIDAEIPNFPLLAHVCHEARAACLRRYSTFRHAVLVARFQDTRRELTEDHVEWLPKCWQYITWIDFEKDVFYMDCDVLSFSESNCDLPRRVGRIYMQRLTAVKKLVSIS